MIIQKVNSLFFVVKSFYIVKTFLRLDTTVSVLFQIVYWGGDHFYLYLWLFAMFMLLFLMTVYPDYIAPLFDKYTPMPAGWSSHLIS